ncbi:hypothetical protein FHL15_002671 [Xylaria flabelliformis]|uniref:JmjC domain-containing protein n=1 Tax=Xylaria flabelliformis TaxID=2512241 RepID=A0A553I868_9PEZI|nr:hypothetical protein FHL15_002671 [Xylaria flabelliformis]
MDPPIFTFVTAVGTAGLSETAAKQMRSHVTKSNFAKRRARIAWTKTEAAKKKFSQQSPESPRQSIVTSGSGLRASRTPFQPPCRDDCPRILSMKWSLLFLDGSEYPGTAEEAAWIRLLLSEPALFESSMAIGLRHWSPCREYQLIACESSSKATETIIQRIGSGRGVTDAVIAAVLTMAFGERLVHNDLAWNIHIDGAVRLVRERISQGLPALSPWIEDFLTEDIINDMFGFPRFYHKKFVNAAHATHDVQCSSLIRIAGLCEKLAKWMQEMSTSRKYPQKSDFIIESIMQPMQDMLAQARAIREDGSPTLRSACITIELIIFLSWSSPQGTINLTAVANELKEAICAKQFRPCHYVELTSCQLMIGAIAADEGSSTRAWFMNRLKSAWQMVKSRGCNDAMEILEKNIVLEAAYNGYRLELEDLLNSKHLKDFFHRDRIRFGDERVGPVGLLSDAERRVKDMLKELRKVPKKSIIWIEGPQIDADDIVNPLSSFANHAIRKAKEAQTPTISYHIRHRGIVTTISGIGTPQSAIVPAAAAQPAIRLYPNPNPNQNQNQNQNQIQSQSEKNRNLTVRRRRRRVPRLHPFNAYRATPYKLVKTYTQKLNRGHPMIIRNLPGFLDGQNWFDHGPDHEVSLKSPRISRRKGSETGFDVLRAILASAVAGRAPGVTDPDLESVSVKTVFDSFEAQCKISQTSLEGVNPPLFLFRDWLQQSQFRDSSLDKTIVELQETYRATPQPWIPFKAPLVFFRAVHQYNRDQRKVKAKDGAVHRQNQSACINGLNGLVILKELMTEEFPFPRIIRDIGQSTYKTISCSIRVGVRPLRSDMRCHKHSTVVVGQLAGYSVVTLIPPCVKLLNGLPLEFHKRVPKTWERSTLRFPLGSSNFALASKTWTRDFENELSASGDILLATLIPGDGLLVPKGWWYGVRSINNGLQLHATVTWFLGHGEMPAGDQEEYDRGKYLQRFAPRVEI